MTINAICYDFDFGSKDLLTVLDYKWGFYFNIKYFVSFHFNLKQNNWFDLSLIVIPLTVNFQKRFLIKLSSFVKFNLSSGNFTRRGCIYENGRLLDAGARFPPGGLASVRASDCSHNCGCHRRTTVLSFCHFSKLLLICQCSALLSPIVLARVCQQPFLQTND